MTNTTRPAEPSRFPRRPASSWTTSTGGPGTWPWSGRAVGWSDCRCRQRQGKRSWRGWPMGGLRATPVACSPRSTRPAGPCRPGPSATWWAARAGARGSPGSALTDCGTPWPRTCCAPGRRCPRWGRFYDTEAPDPPPSTPRSTRSRCGPCRGPGPAPHRGVHLSMRLLGAWHARGREHGHEHAPGQRQRLPGDAPRDGLQGRRAGQAAGKLRRVLRNPRRHPRPERPRDGVGHQDDQGRRQ